MKLNNLSFKNKLLLMFSALIVFIVILMITFSSFLNSFAKQTTNFANGELKDKEKTTLLLESKNLFIESNMLSYLGKDALLRLEQKSENPAEDFANQVDVLSGKVSTIYGQLLSLHLENQAKSFQAGYTPIKEELIKWAEDVNKKKLDFNQASEKFSKNRKDLKNFLKENASFGDVSSNEVVELLRYVTTTQSLFKKIGLGILLALVLVSLGFNYILRKMTNQFEELVNNFSLNVHEVQNSSQKLDLISKKLIGSVDTQSKSIAGSAQAIEEISAMINTSTDSSSNASRISDNAKQSADDGKNKINNLLQEVQGISYSYDEIQKCYESNNQNMEKISDVINEISNKTKVIHDIVFQTKLLSFNASVEAARAGEDGKGFAVVAEEVGNLAQMSSKAAVDIEELIKTSTSEVNRLTTEAQQKINSILFAGRDKIKSGDLVANDCKNQLDSILENSIQLNVAIKEITSANSEQLIGIEEVNKVMRSLENETQQTSMMSDRTKEASQSLMDQAHSLRQSTQELRKLLGSKNAYNASSIAKDA